MYNTGLMYQHRGRDGEGSVVRQREKQTKVKERETWIGKGSVAKTDREEAFKALREQR